MLDYQLFWLLFRKKGEKLLVRTIVYKHKNHYCFKTQAKMSGATMVASDSTINLGV
jgi:hypothetical protein